MILQRASQAQNEAPPIKPYQEALDFQRKRTPMLRDQFYSRAMDAARPRAFTITGLTKYSSLLEAHRIGETAIAESMTMSDYADRLGEVVDAHGGTILSPERLELIHHNTMVNNNAAGAWRQMTDPEFVVDRPYFRYRGPRDGRNSRICLRIHGIVVHHTDPILKHMWHPNHHWERHEWESLAADDVNPDNVYKSPDGYEYPVVDGVEVRPADGWDFHPAEAMAADDSSFRRGIEQLGAELPAKAPADYGIGRLSSIATEDLPPAPPLPRDVTKLTAEEQWAMFREMVGMTAAAERTILLDYAQDGVWINRDTFDHLGGHDQSDRKDKADRISQVPSLLATLRDPAEVWWVPRETAAGVVFSKRYFGVFSVGDRERPRTTVVFLERTPEGLMWNSGWIKTAEKKLTNLRRGLLAYTKVPKAGGQQ